MGLYVVHLSEMCLLWLQVVKADPESEIREKTTTKKPMKRT